MIKYWMMVITVKTNIMTRYYKSEDIVMVKTFQTNEDNKENDIIESYKEKFYNPLVDDIESRRNELNSDVRVIFNIILLNFEDYNIINESINDIEMVAKICNKNSCFCNSILTVLEPNDYEEYIKTAKRQAEEYKMITLPCCNIPSILVLPAFFTFHKLDYENISIENICNYATVNSLTIIRRNILRKIIKNEYCLLLTMTHDEFDSDSKLTNQTVIKMELTDNDKKFLSNIIDMNFDEDLNMIRHDLSSQISCHVYMGTRKED